jgi:hypothetical protein
MASDSRTLPEPGSPDEKISSQCRDSGHVEEAYNQAQGQYACAGGQKLNGVSLSCKTGSEKSPECPEDEAQKTRQTQEACFHEKLDIATPFEII